MDDFTKEELEQLFAVFRDQSLQILDEMGQDLLTLESKGIDIAVMSRLRRAAHTIKGDSACIGLEGVTRIAHWIEDTFDAAVKGEGFDSRVVDVILEGLDAIRDSVSSDDVTDVPPERLDRILANVALSTVMTEADSQANEVGPTAEHDESGTPDSQPVSAEGAPEEDKEGKGILNGKHRREYVRVEAARIDALLNLAGEMVIARSVMNQISPELERALEKNELVSRFGGASTQMGKLIAELQKSVLKMRMVTIDQVFKRFSRPMRELAAERNKQLELVVAGGETELDRTLVDLLYEPLLHLLRNAVDHGLETTEERRALGKSVPARIAMRAYHEGNQVVVEVSDDGRGIDVTGLKARAVESGEITQSEADQMPHEEALELIFLQGLSTAREITLVSGRGVGAAAVRTAVEQLRGSVSIKSEPGSGTTFILRMPLTLAIIKALLFSASGQLFAVPLLSVTEIARAEESEIILLDGFESYRLRDKFISLVRPGAVLGFERRKGGSSGAGLRPERKKSFIIVLSAGSKRYGLVADSLSGEQELVIKPLDSKWVQNDALAGASVLGDGRVVLIMDAGMVFRKAIKYERAKGAGKGAYAI